MMTDLYDPTGPIGDASLDDMALYSEIPADPSSTHDSAVDIGQNFAFEAHQMSNEHLEDVMLSSEGFTSNYIPHSSEVDINNMQAYNSYDDNAQVSFSAPQHGGHPLAWHAPSSAPPSPATMTEFFQMMSQPENVQAYMHFLQTQHEQAPQAPAPPPPLRSRSNSNPTSSSLPSAFSLRPSSTEAPFEASARDKKLAKYRTKRARRLTGSQISNSEPSPAPALAAATEGVEGERFMPAPKIQKTLAHGTSIDLVFESFGASPFSPPQLSSPLLCHSLPVPKISLDSSFEAIVPQSFGSRAVLGSVCQCVSVCMGCVAGQDSTLVSQTGVEISYSGHRLTDPAILCSAICSGSNRF